MCYKNNDYDEALIHFNRVKYHKTFGPLAAVYVAQVYFARKQYQDVINFCDSITKPEIANDVAGLIGQSHYQLKDYHLVSTSHFQYYDVYKYHKFVVKHHPQIL